MKVILKDVRLAFPDLFTPKAQLGDDGNPGTPKYGCALIYEPDHPCVKLLHDAEAEVAKAKWGAKAEAYLKEVKANGRDVVQDGNKKASYDGYSGMQFTNANRKADGGRPTVIDRDRTPLAAGDGKPYAGCYVIAHVNVWAQDNKKGGKRINAELSGVQFLRDGDSFSAGAPPADVDDFADLGVDDSEHDPLLD